MAGCVYKGNFLGFMFYLISTNVLGYTAVFLALDVGLAYGIKNTGLSVVNVAHNGNNRRAGKFFSCVIGFFFSHSCILKK